MIPETGPDSELMKEYRETYCRPNGHLTLPYHDVHDCLHKTYVEALEEIVRVHEPRPQNPGAEARP